MLQFVREIPVLIVIHGALSQRRGFLFRLQAGFSKPVDPLSGMSANLTKVDQWLSEVQMDLQAQTFYSTSAENFNEALLEIHEATRADLQGLAQSDGTSLESLHWIEERGVEVSWQASWGQTYFSTRHFIEDFSSGHFELLKLRLSWSLPPENLTIDLGHQGFLLLRGLEKQKTFLFIEKLAPQVAQNEFAQKHLHQAEIEFVASRRKLILEKVDFQSGL
jgi:hypothetical protein